MAGPISSRGLVVRLAVLVAIVLAAADAAFAATLLPDLIAWEAGPPRNYMRDGQMDQTTIANRVLYRFTQPIANIGDGPLELREVTHPNNVQDIYQRIYDSLGGISEQVVGSFPNADPPYGHMFLVGIAEYRIRTVTSGNGVGPVVASQIKTSYGLYDNDAYDIGLPSAPDTSQYVGADQYLGISVGWADLYPWWFSGQYIDVTGVPDGQYWLEAEIDPYNLLEETDDSNNITRVLVNLVVPEPTIMPGDYNQDNVVNAADYVVWRKMFGREVPRGTRADGDGDGVIDMPDLDVWRSEFGRIAPGGAAGTVPEPSVALLLLTLGMFCGRRGRTVGRCGNVLQQGARSASKGDRVGFRLAARPC
jgi:hypothetical protein